jgi:hypothetical protein
MADDGDSRVGYKRPPQHSKFKPGKSGNPKGRPKGALNLETDLTQEFSEKIAIREGECCLNVSKQRALAKSVVAKAFKGDICAASLVFQLVAKFVVLEEVASMRERDLLSDDEAAILERFIAKRIADQI